MHANLIAELFLQISLKVGFSETLRLIDKYRSIFELRSL